jgi:maltoporin
MTFRFRLLPLAAALMASAPAFAQKMPVEFTGYFRSGLGVTAGGGDQACFQLPGAATTYRLGNECSTFGEFSLGGTVLETAEGTKFRIGTMFAYGVPQQRVWEQSEADWRQAYVEVLNMGSGAFANATLWAGKRYVDRHDVHITDFFYWDNSGPGAGIENVDVGVGKFSYALRRNGRLERSAEQNGHARADQTQLLGHDFRLQGIPVNPNGTLAVGIDIRHAHSDDDIDNEGGYALTVQHQQTKIFNDGYNKLAFQYGKGSVSNLDFRNPSLDAAKNDRTWRIVESVVWQPGNGLPLSGQATFVYQDTDAAGGAGGKWRSIGARPIYHFTDRWSAALEIGHDRYKPDNGDTRSLSKLTLAAQYGTAKNFWARPVIRAFWTHARWNTAAQAAAADGDPLSATGIFDDKKSGNTFGVQAEVWW